LTWIVCPSDKAGIVTDEEQKGRGNLVAALPQGDECLDVVKIVRDPGVHLF
jgi:hypothetical protein